MPTDPPQMIIDRQLSITAAAPLLEVASATLQEIVNYSAQLLIRCSDARKSEEQKNEEVSIFLLYLHMLELTDAIEALISQSCPYPAIPLLRSSFEALIGMDYILQEDFTRRSLSWLVGTIHAQLHYIETHDPSTPSSQARQQTLVADKYLDYYELPIPGKASAEDFRQRAIHFQTILEQPQFQPIENEFRRLKKLKKRPKWYQLFDGPENLRELAIRVGSLATYDEMYSNWSEIVHPLNMARFMSLATSENSVLPALRNPNALRQVTTHAAQFMLAASKLLVGKFQPSDKDIREWYEREVMANLLAISGGS